MSELASAKIEWTPAQRAAIETTGKAVLVSAAAGSGKTAALSERCVHLVCDAPARCDIDQLLVLTFTKAAAAEMRFRIDSALRKRAEANDDDELARQVRLLDRATITTLDAYCLTVVRSNFHSLGIDPGFRLLDNDEAKLLRVDVGRTLIADEYERDESRALRSLIDETFNGDDDELVGKVIACHDLLCSVVDPESWLKTTLDHWREALADLKHSKLADEFARLQALAIAGTRAELQRARRIAASDADTKPYVAHIDLMLALVDPIEQLIQKRDWDTLAATMEKLDFGRAPTVRSQSPRKEIAKKALDRAKKELKEGPTFQLLRWDTQTLHDAIANALPHVETFVRLVREFRVRFAREKAGLRALDFADLESLALRALRAPATEGPLVPSRAALDLREQFKHVLVDEYQDINPLQDALLQLLSTDIDAAGRCDAEADLASNLFCVGDVKQSIYGFRLAEPGRFLARQDRLRNASKTEHGAAIDLQTNFRSRPGVLESVNHVFRALMSRRTCGIDYDAQHELQPGKQAFPVDAALRHFTGKPVEVHLISKDAAQPSHDERPPASDDEADDLDAFEREALVIASRINDLVRPPAGRSPAQVTDKIDGASRLRPIEFRDIAVLLRSARVKASQAAAQLRQFGIPVHALDPTGFFDATEVQDLLALLRVLSNGRQDIPLAALLRSPLIRIDDPPILMAAIRATFPDRAMSFADAVYAFRGRTHDPLARELNSKLLNYLPPWRALVTRRPLAEGLDQILRDTSYLSYCGGLRDGAQRVANIHEFRRRAEQFGAFERQGLERFLRFIDDLQREDDLGQPSTESEGANVVRVMTVHRSKGLEFPVVIVPDLGKRHNTQSLNGGVLFERHAGIGMVATDFKRRVKYPTLPTMVVQVALREQMVAEEIRVLYVALTRAKEHLILIGSAKNEHLTQVRETFADHAGPLPAEYVLSAATPLDWLMPVFDATNRAVPGTFDLQVHDAAAIQTMAKSMPSARNDDRVDDAIRNLRPLPVPAPADATSDRIVKRFAWRYPFAHLASESSRRSMSDASHGTDARRFSPEPSVRVDTDPAALLEWPRFAEVTRRANAADIGTATHLALQHVDFKRTAGVDDVRRQFQELIAKKLISERDAGLVDADAIAWLAGTDFGQLLAGQRGARRIWTELDVARRCPHPAAAPDSPPADDLLLRGRLDVLIETDAGLIIGDYKTDRVTKEHLDDRVELYRPQVKNYADALSAITGLPVVETCLAFLWPRELRKL